MTFGIVLLHILIKILHGEDSIQFATVFKYLELQIKSLLSLPPGSKICIIIRSFKKFLCNFLILNSA